MSGTGTWPQINAARVSSLDALTSRLINQSFPFAQSHFRAQDRLPTYRNGVLAKWEHILSAADCVRIERLAEIHRKLATAPIVIIRDASGQGKSTLGWRYMHDFGDEGLRFHVRRVESPLHHVF